MQRGTPTTDGPPIRVKGYRWTILALVFFAMTVNYLDRQVFSLMVPFFENDLRLSPPTSRSPTSPSSSPTASP